MKEIPPSFLGSCVVIPTVWGEWIEFVPNYVTKPNYTLLQEYRILHLEQSWDPEFCQSTSVISKTENEQKDMMPAVCFAMRIPNCVQLIQTWGHRVNPKWRFCRCSMNFFGISGIRILTVLWIRLRSHFFNCACESKPVPGFVSNACCATR